MVWFLIFWLIAAIIAKGLCFGTVQKGWPDLAEEGRRTDHILSGIIALFGPIGILAVLVASCCLQKRPHFKLW